MNKRIEVSLGKTINLGNYESVKVQVGLSVDVKNKMSIDEKFDRVYKELNLKLDDYCDNIERKHTNEKKNRK